MRLHNLQPAVGAKRRKKRLGQGRASGHGTTSGRGGKGQSARSGRSIRPGFEGGQMPLARRLPKRGFSNTRFRREYAVVNLDCLAQFAEGSRVDEALLREKGLVRGAGVGLKVLGRGDCPKGLVVVAAAFSALAKAKILGASGTCEVTEPGHGGA